MTTNIIDQGNTSPLPTDLSQVTTDALKARLAQQMELTAQHLQEMAYIWVELEHRGVDLSELRTGLTDYLGKIASGELDARAVVQFAGSRQLLRYLSTLPIAEQHALVERGMVELVLPGSGDTTTRKLTHLSSSEVTQVFGHGIVRDTQAQRQLLESKSSIQKADRKRNDKKHAARIAYNRLEVGGQAVYADGKPLKADDLLALLSDHYGVNLADALAGR